jgi:hypothetical protein
VKRASAQNLMRLIGNVQSIGSTHFLDRSALLLFLDEVVAADRVSEAVAKRNRRRVDGAGRSCCGSRCRAICAR